MADAQDLKSCHKRFYRVLLRCSRVDIHPVNIGQNALFTRLQRPGDFRGESSTNDSTNGFSQAVELQKDALGLKSCAPNQSADSAAWRAGLARILPLATEPGRAHSLAVPFTKRGFAHCDAE
jgi:hypothetical protein